MSMTAEYKDCGAYESVTVQGSWSLEGFFSLVDEIAAHMKSSQHRKILVDGRMVPGGISGVDRFDGGKYVAKAMVGWKIALLHDPKWITKLGEHVAVNRGAQFAVFGGEENAVAWLTQPRRRGNT